MAAKNTEQLAGALDNLLVQVYQMRGLFDDDDGSIAAAIKDAEEALNPSKEHEYDVCVYHLVRTMVRSVKAKSPQEAARIAHDEVLGIVDQIQLYYGKGEGCPEYTEDAEEVQGYSVFPAGSEEATDDDLYLEYNEDGELEVCEMKSYDQLRNGSKS